MALLAEQNLNHLTDLTAKEENEPCITMAHGGGGLASRKLVREVFLQAFGVKEAETEDDQVRFPLADMTGLGDRLALTADSYVIDPVFFPGGDIGKLAVCGTVNDLAVGGAVPLYLTCCVILEEGLPLKDLKKIVNSMAATAKAAGVKIATGDTKTVKHGAGDKIFINTAGVGVIPRGISLGAEYIRPGDAVLVNGFLGDHGAAVLSARNEFGLSGSLQSDCAALHELTAKLLKDVPSVRFMRDATRGGLAAVLNEAAASAKVDILIDEAALPLRSEVRGLCEFLGLDPLYLANEGKVIIFTAREDKDKALSLLRSHLLGKESAIIGEVREEGSLPGVQMKTAFGGYRMIDMLVGDQLPRIC